MQFNLLETGYVTVSGTPYISLESLQDILSVNGTTTISGSGNDNLYIDCDLVDRIGVDEVKYYFDSTTDSGTVASGIHFYYKNDAPVTSSGAAPNPYLNLTTNVGNGYYFTTVPGLSAPRYIRLNHTVSGTTISGTIVGFEVLNDDSVVDFGADGNLTSSSTLTSLSYLNYNDYIKEIEIYNGGSSVAIAHVFIDPQYNDSDALLSISASEDGPWVFAINTDYIISNANNWDVGRYDNTYTVGYSNAWNPDSKDSAIVLSNQNLTATSINTHDKSVKAIQGISNTMQFSNKWYWEITIDLENSTVNTQLGVGKATVSNANLISDSVNGYSYRADGYKCNNGSCLAYGDSFTTNDVVGVALDMDDGKLYFSKNGVWQDSAVLVSGTNPAFSGLTGEFYPMASLYDSGDKITVNFGLNPLSYTIPDGFLSFAPLLSDGKLRLSTGYMVGTYTTPIFRNDSVKFAYIDVLQTAVSGSIVAVDSDDYTSTIQIRSSSSKPIDYNVYRKLYYAGVSYQNQFWYKDFLTATDTEVYDSYDATGTMFGASWHYYSYTYKFDCTQFVIDEDTQKTAFISVTGRGVAPNTGVYTIDLMILSQNGVQLEYKRLAYAGLPYRSILYNMRFDSEGGIWLYNYTNFTANRYNLTDVLDDSHAISEEGYWLLHLDSDLNILYNSGVGSSNLVVGECAPVIGDTSLWYCTKQGTQAVIKLTSSGTVGFSYEYVTDLKGLCSTDDGGCWFIDNDDLHKLNSSGGLEDSIINIDIGSELTFVAFDSEDVNYLWIVDGVYIKRIRLDGTVFRSIYLEGFTINRLLTTSEGLWVYCTEGKTGDNYAKYIGKLSSGVEKTIECVTDAGEGDPSDVGIKSVSYDNLSLGNLIPLSDDTIWNDDLEWNKAVTVNAVLPREEYNQFKLTLRRSNVSIDLPTVENIYYQDSVELTDTYPGQSETLYLRISLPDGVTIGGDYASNLRVWWELPVV